MTKQWMLIEIGLEEVPARFLPNLEQNFDKAMKDIFKKWDLQTESWRSFASPRRMGVLALCQTNQEDRIEELAGPPKRIAFDAEGNPSRALEGFLKKSGVQLQDLITIIDEKKGEEKLAVRKEIKGQSLNVLLQDSLGGIIKNLPQPKTMRWDNSGLEFIRPIRWVMAMLDDQIIPAKLGNMIGSNQTFGLRQLGNKSITISSAQSYEAQMKENHIYSFRQSRAEKIAQDLVELEKKEQISINQDKGLLHEWADLAEHPRLIVGSFGDRFLDLPEPVLTTSLKVHQKAMSVKDKPLFISLADGIDDPSGWIRKGSEWVLKARLFDAAFFYEEDIKKPLADRRSTLENMTYHKDLGSFAHRVDRMISLADSLADLLHVDSTKLKQVCDLAKMDLATAIVFEFPELEAITGAFLARHEGLDDEMALAIEEHLQPRGDEDIPGNDLGCAVALIDKLEALVGGFGVGLRPTGSKDPYALRRAGLGVVKILSEKAWKIPFADLVKMTYDIIIADGRTLADDTVEACTQFLIDRAKNLIKKDVNPLALQAGFSQRIQNEFSVERLRLVTALSNMMGDSTLLDVAALCRRAVNLAEKEPDIKANAVIDAGDEVERALAKTIVEIQPKIDQAREALDWSEALKYGAQLKDPLNQFFVDVMVMSKDENEKTRRIGLLKSVDDLFNSWVDLAGIKDLSK